MTDSYFPTTNCAKRPPSRMRSIATLGCLAALALTAAACAQPTTAEPAPAPTESSGANQQLAPDIPPEVWQQIQRAYTSAPATPPTKVKLSPRYRTGLVALAVAILFAGGIICRLFRAQRPNAPQSQAAGPLFGLFAGIAALLLAAAVVGTLYLHLAATACTVISGFTVSTLLLGQFTTLRRWAIGQAVETQVPSDETQPT